MSAGATTRAPEAADATTTTKTRPAIRSAGRVLLMGVGFGLLAQLLFFRAAPGINVLLATVALLGAAWRVRRLDRSRGWQDVWLPVGAIAYAAFIAIRDDTVLVVTDLLVCITLTGATMASFGGAAVIPRPLLAIGHLAGRFIGWAALGSVWAVADVGPRSPRRQLLGPISRVLPVLRGLVVAIPIALIFVALFAAADAVFANLVAEILTIDVDLDELVGRTVLAVVLGGLATGGLAFTAAAIDVDDPPPIRHRWLGATEATTVLLTVGAVFVVFVTLQAAYLFGGLDTVRAAGITYAEYARRGFFELIAVAALAGGLLLAAETFITRRPAAYLGAALAFVALTGVVLVSAVLRLRLYQEAYGWTELRFYALAAIAWLGTGLALGVGALLANRSRWLPHALVVAALAVGLGVNLIGPVRFVAEQNVARLEDPRQVAPFGQAGLDTAYATLLSNDAVPALVRAVPLVPRLDRAVLQRSLDARLQTLTSEAEFLGWQSWNLSRATAVEALRSLDG